MAKKPIKPAKKEAPKAAPAASGGPPKHLAYITEEEAKLLDMILTIKKGAKGKDGKPLPQTYSPGQGNPMEFLTELTPEQISQLLAKTDGESDTTEHGVESYADDSASSRGVSRGDKSQATKGSVAAKPASATKSSVSSFNSGVSKAPSKDGGDSSFGNITSSVKTTPAKTTFKTETVKPSVSGARDDRMPSAPIAKTVQPSSQAAVVRQQTLGKPANIRGLTEKSSLAALAEQHSQYRSPPGAPLTQSGEGKTDRENVTTIEQNGVSPFGKNVGFTQSNTSIPAASELAALAASTKPPPKTNTTVINKDPNGPMPKVTPDDSSALAGLATNSQFNNPLADDPGAYDESELANAVTDEGPRTLGGANKTFQPGVQQDPTATEVDSNLSLLAGNQPTGEPVSAPGKTDREIPLTSGAGKTDRVVKDIILGNAPIPAAPQPAPFSDASLANVARKPAATRGLNTVPDSSLSPLATQKFQDRLAPEEGALGQVTDGTATQKNSSLPTLQQMSERDFSAQPAAPDDFITSPSQEERDQFMPSQPVAAPPPVSSLQSLVDEGGAGTEEVIDPGMPDIGFDANQPEVPPTLFDPEAPPAPALPPDGAGDGGEVPVPIGNEGPEPAPVPGDTDGGEQELMPGVMPWDRAAFAEIAAAYEGAGQTYTPEMFKAAFYNAKPYTIEHPEASNDDLVSGDPSIDPYAGIMPHDRGAYNQLRKSYEAIGQTYTPQQFVMQFYAKAA